MKRILLVAFVCLAFMACSSKTASNQEGLRFPTVSGKIWNYTETVSEKPVMIAFMAGFCGFCKMMAPLLDQMAGDLKGQNVDVVLAFVDENGEEVKEIAKNLNIKNAKVAYNTGDFAQTMGVTGFPQMYLIGTDGMVAQGWTGYSTTAPAEMQAKIEEINKK